MDNNTAQNATIQYPDFASVPSNNSTNVVPPSTPSTQPTDTVIENLQKELNSLSNPVNEQSNPSDIPNLQQAKPFINPREPVEEIKGVV